MDTSSPKRKYRGVVRYRTGRWLAKTYGHGQNIHLGYYDTDIEAAKAYDCAQVLLNGPGMPKNIPGLPDLDMMDKISHLLSKRNLLIN